MLAETKHEVSHRLTPFFGIRDELSMQDGIVLRGERVVIPKSLQHQMVSRVHSVCTHQNGQQSVSSQRVHLLAWDEHRCEALH